MSFYVCKCQILDRGSFYSLISGVHIYVFAGADNAALSKHSWLSSFQLWWTVLILHSKLNFGYLFFYCWILCFCRYPMFWGWHYVFGILILYTIFCTIHIFFFRGDLTDILDCKKTMMKNTEWDHPAHSVLTWLYVWNLSFRIFWAHSWSESITMSRALSACFRTYKTS